MDDAHKYLAPRSFCLCPGFEPLDLAVEIRLLICLAEQVLDFGSRNACFATYPNHLDFTHFNPTSDRDGV
jgi:hypothetical protein